MTGGEAAALDERALALADAVAMVAAASDAEHAADMLTAAAASVLGAPAAWLGLVQPDGSLRAVAVHSELGGDLTRWQRIPLSTAMPVAETVRTSRSVRAFGRDEVLARWPDLPPDGLATGRPMPPGTEVAVIAVPLLAGGTCLGALGVVMASTTPPADWQVRSLEALAGATAQAITRLAASAAAAEATDKLEFLDEAAEVLAGSLDYEATLRSVAGLVVPRLADWCSIDVLEDGVLRRVAVSHVDPDKVRYGWELWERYPTELDAPSGAARVLRTGVSELVEAVDESVLDEADLEPDLRRIVKELQIESGVTVALVARGRTLGVISLLHAESGRRYGPDDVRFAEDLARRAAVAIDNAQLHTETMQVALQLQRAVLPSSYADSAEWRVAVHYRPAGRSEVGGDFFDAITLADGRLAVAVGDVMGRGVAAAAAMAQVRSALRAYLVDDPDPGRVVGRLDRMFSVLDVAQLVTLIYGLVEPSGEGQWHSAGHLPPLVVRPDGQVVPMSIPPAPPLGTGVHDRVSTVISTGPDDVVLLYSDGLVERRGEDIDEGLTRLEVAAASLTRQVSDARLTAIADELRLAGHDDDVTVLAYEHL